MFPQSSLGDLISDQEHFFAEPRGGSLGNLFYIFIDKCVKICLDYFSLDIDTLLD